MSNNDPAAQTRGTLLNDLKSGFLVFLIALPLCLGISLASGFPPVAGVLTAIIGGLVVSFLGSSRLTIKGPAAGLIVIALGAVQELGGGDPMLGYKRALAVGAVAAVIQIVLALLRAASLGVAMSPSVVHGMLAAIGVIIVSKQAHVTMGVNPEGSEPLELLAEIPKSMMHANPEILLIGVVSLIILFGMPLIKAKWVKAIPAAIVVLLVAVPLDLYFNLDAPHDYSLFSHSYHVGPEFLVTLPSSLLDALVFPDFSVVFSPASLKYVVMFALVGMIESTLSVIAVDSMDPEKRPSNLNRDLLGVGVGNLACSLVGGLPMISEIVRSKANIDAGAKSRMSNFFHGGLLLLFVALTPELLHQIPLAALAAMLVYTGARLASPSQLIHAKKIGTDQLMLFVTTLVVTLATDLLIGVGVGIVLKLILHRARGASMGKLFKARIEEKREGSELQIAVHGAAAFTSLLRIRKALEQVDESIERVVVDLSDVALVDHTFLLRIDALANEWPKTELVYKGADHLSSVSTHEHATQRKLA